MSGDNNLFDYPPASRMSPMMGQGPPPGMRMPFGMMHPNRPPGPGMMPGMVGPGPGGPGPGPGGPGPLPGGPPGPHGPGKVYPANQSMVFNPSNPNAPPIYPCGVCHKEVHDNDQAILCESGCNFWFHRPCTGLSEGAFVMLKEEVYAEWVCDKCLQLKSIPLVKLKP